MKSDTWGVWHLCLVPPLVPRGNLFYFASRLWNVKQREDFNMETRFLLLEELFVRVELFDSICVNVYATDKLSFVCWQNLIYCEVSWLVHNRFSVSCAEQFCCLLMLLLETSINWSEVCEHFTLFFIVLCHWLLRLDEVSFHRQNEERRSNQIKIN